MPSSRSAAGAPRPSRDVIVRCSGEGHRVRLAGGLRFFAPARCPRCKAAVDPLRWRRVVAAVAVLGRPRGSGPLDRIVHGAVLAYVGAVVAAALLLWAGGDLWWPATVLLFGPRWVLLLPLVPLVPAAWLRDRALLVPLAVGAWVGIGPLVGVRAGVRALLPAAGEGPTLRIATFNAGGGDDLPHVSALLAEWNVDVAVFQECGGIIRGQIEAVGREGSPLDSHTAASLCMTSRLPLLEVTDMDRDAFEFAGGSGLVRTYVLDWYGQRVAVTNVHLETQRAGLELFRSGRVRAAIPRLREKAFLRSVELRAARRWVDSLDMPRVVAGDFNTPPESRTYRTAWEGWTNAFDARGRGLGGTRLNGWILARIDHVLVDDAWRVVDVEVGDDVGSDHLPVMATLRAR